MDEQSYFGPGPSQMWTRSACNQKRKPKIWPSAGVRPDHQIIPKSKQMSIIFLDGYWRRIFFEREIEFGQARKLSLKISWPAIGREMRKLRRVNMRLLELKWRLRDQTTIGHKIVVRNWPKLTKFLCRAIRPISH